MDVGFLEEGVTVAGLLQLQQGLFLVGAALVQDLVQMQDLFVH